MARRERSGYYITLTFKLRNASNALCNSALSDIDITWISQGSSAGGGEGVFLV